MGEICATPILCCTLDQRLSQLYRQKPGQWKVLAALCKQERCTWLPCSEHVPSSTSDFLQCLVKKLLPSAEEETSSNIQVSYNPKQILFRWFCVLQSQWCLAENLQPQEAADYLSCEVPSIAVVAARGPAVPTPGTAGPPGKPENWFMISELQPFIDTISMLTLRNLPQGQDSLAHIPWKVREHCKLAHMALYPTGHASFSP